MPGVFDDKGGEREYYGSVFYLKDNSGHREHTKAEVYL